MRWGEGKGREGGIATVDKRDLQLGFYVTKYAFTSFVIYYLSFTIQVVRGVTLTIRAVVKCEVFDPVGHIATVH